MYRQLQEEKIRRRRQSKIRFIEIYASSITQSLLVSFLSIPIPLPRSCCFLATASPVKRDQNKHKSISSLSSPLRFIFIYI